MDLAGVPINQSRILLNVPILNEIENIERLVTNVHKELEGLDYVLLIVDDGSTDGTLEYLEKVVPSSGGRIVVLHHQKTIPGCQRGAALLAGLRWGLGHGPFDIFVEMDGDLSHRPEELRDGIKSLAEREADIAIASKYVRGSQITGRTLDRTAISIICNAAVRSLIRWNISDFSNGYRFYNRRAASLIPQYSIRYGSPIYLTEVMAIWLSNGMRVVEIPSHYVGRHEGWSKVRWRDYAKAAFGVLEIALRYRVTGFAEDADLALHPTAEHKPALVEEQSGSAGE
jgi:dolichol-phosphate mannosyltransferase